MIHYLTVAEALTIHADQIARYGGSSGVRNARLLEAHCSGRKADIMPT